MNKKSLSRRTIEGFAWMVAGAGGQAALRITVLAVLSRLLTPTDFGVIGAALTVVVLADILGTIGVAPAIVQMPQIGRRHLRTAFTVSVLLGVLMTCLINLAAPLIADLFRIPAMEPAVQMLSVVFGLRSFSVVAEAKLQREMRFRALSVIGVTSYLLGYGVVAIALAFAGFGIWSLVVGQIVQVAVASLCFIVIGRHPAAPLLDLAVMRKLFGFGVGITLSSLGNYIALSVDQFIVGRWLGAAPLGFYNRAYTILMQPVNLVGAVGDKVLFPALSSIQDDGERLARAYLRAFGLIALATIPLSGFLMLFAKEIVLVLLGGQWLEIVLPFQILVATMFFRTAYKISSTLLRARGMTYRLALWQWLYAGSVAIGAVLGSQYGLVGVSAGVGAAIVATFGLGLMFARKACPLSWHAIATTIARYVVVSAVINLPLWLLKPSLLMFGLHPAAIVAACGIGALAMTAVIWFAARPLLRDDVEWLGSSLRRGND